MRISTLFVALLFAWSACAAKEEIPTGTAALIISLCSDHGYVGTAREHGTDKAACIKSATLCSKYYKDKGYNRTYKCFQEAIDDNASKWATGAGYRTKKTSNYKWAKW